MLFCATFVYMSTLSSVQEGHFSSFYAVSLAVRLGCNDMVIHTILVKVFYHVDAKYSFSLPTV